MSGAPPPPPKPKLPKKPPPLIPPGSPDPNGFTSPSGVAMDGHISTTLNPPALPPQPAPRGPPKPPPNPGATVAVDLPPGLPFPSLPPKRGSTAPPAAQIQVQPPQPLLTTVAGQGPVPNGKPGAQRPPLPPGPPPTDPDMFPSGQAPPPPPPGRGGMRISANLNAPAGASQGPILIQPPKQGPILPGAGVAFIPPAVDIGGQPPPMLPPKSAPSGTMPPPPQGLVIEQPQIPGDGLGTLDGASTITADEVDKGKVKGRREEKKKGKDKDKDKKSKGKDKEKNTNAVPGSMLDETATLSRPAGVGEATMERSGGGGGFWANFRRSFSKSKKDQPALSASIGGAGAGGGLNATTGSMGSMNAVRMSRTTDDIATVPMGGTLGMGGTMGRTAASTGALSHKGFITRVSVIMLDGEDVPFDVDKKAMGSALFDQVCLHMDLVETDFFGLTFVHEPMRTWLWLDLSKPLNKQMDHMPESSLWQYRFQVKFYPPDPPLMREEVTRYQLCLQIRQDIFYGKLPCSWVTQALLGSYMVQSELGDYDDSIHGQGFEYLRGFAFVNNQTDELLAKVAELHKTHKGITPMEADQRYLENAKRLELYGVDLHLVMDAADTPVQVGICHSGILLYGAEGVRLNRFAWPKVLRIAYRKSYFLLRIRSDEFEAHEIDIELKLENHKLAKRLWKICVENHTFFRLNAPRKEAKGSMGSLMSLGHSKVRYTGHTLQQTRQMSIERIAEPTFQRLATKRMYQSMPSLVRGAGMQTAGSLSGSTMLLPPPRAGNLNMKTAQSVEVLGAGKNMMLRSTTVPAKAKEDAKAAAKKEKGKSKEAPDTLSMDSFARGQMVGADADATGRMQLMSETSSIARAPPAPAPMPAFAPAPGPVPPPNLNLNMQVPARGPFPPPDQAQFTQNGPAPMPALPPKRKPLPPQPAPH